MSRTARIIILRVTIASVAKISPATPDERSDKFRPRRSRYLAVKDI